MNYSGKDQSFLKKAYEIAYALSRVAERISEPSLAGKISEKSIELMALAVDGKYSEINHFLPGLEMLIRFGVDINYVGPQNGEILLKEIGNLIALIPDANHLSTFEEKSVTHPKKAEEIDLSHIFSDAEPVILHSDLEIEPGHHLEETKFEFGNEYGNRQSGNGGMKPEIRQSAILERIRQTGNCRLNDIQAILPDASERTIRYDLESLVQSGKVERVGVGGRGVYYRLNPQGNFST